MCLWCANYSEDNNAVIGILSMSSSVGSAYITTVSHFLLSLEAYSDNVSLSEIICGCKRVNEVEKVERVLNYIICSSLCRYIIENKITKTWHYGSFV